MTDKDKPDDTSIPIYSGEVTHDEYWFLHVTGTEWIYVVQRLIDQYLKDVPIEDKPIILGQTAETDAVMFMLRKKFLPVEAVVRATGVPLETWQTNQTIKLTVSKKDLPDPTVNYWGTA